MWAIIFMAILFDIACFVLFLNTANTEWKMLSGLSALGFILGLASTVWIIGFALEFSGAKKLWKELNDD